MSLALDTEPRVVVVPDDLAGALDAHRDAARLFARLSYSHQRQYVEWVSEAKRADTRQRRIAETVKRVADAGGRRT